MKYLIFITLITFLYICNNSDSQDLLPIITKTKTNGQKVKKYLDNDTFLDVDVQALLKQKCIPSSRSTLNEKDALCKMKAAIYRFYSHVKIKDGKYSCSLTNAREINISNQLFSTLRQNLESGNVWIEKCKKEGKEIVIPEINEEYLNSLLQ